MKMELIDRGPMMRELQERIDGLRDGGVASIAVEMIYRETMRMILRQPVIEVREVQENDGRD